MNLIFVLFPFHKVRVSPTAIHKGCRNLHLSLGNLSQDLTQSMTRNFFAILPLSVLYVVSVTNLLLSRIEQGFCRSSVRDGV